jgi:hypothetical protein
MNGPRLTALQYNPMLTLYKESFTPAITILNLFSLKYKNYVLTGNVNATEQPDRFRTTFQLSALYLLEKILFKTILKNLKISIKIVQSCCGDV